jgi:hypothetical protein
MENRIYEDLPANIAAIRAIMKQPFYGMSRHRPQDFVIQYIYSHAYWYVGDYAGLMQVRGRCGNEVLTMEKNYFTRTGKRLSLC